LISNVSNLGNTLKTLQAPYIFFDKFTKADSAAPLTPECILHTL